MLPKLQELEQRLAALPAEEQSAWIARFLDQLQRQTNGGQTKAPIESKPIKGEWIGGRQPTPEEVAEAVAGLRRFREGNILGDDITIRELIDDGRRY